MQGDIGGERERKECEKIPRVINLMKRSQTLTKKEKREDAS